MRRTAFALPMMVFVAIAGFGAGQGPGGGSDRLTADVLSGFALRNIGPTLNTGRIADVAIDPKNPSVWYVVSAFGGVWKTENRGITFTPIFDNYGSFTMCCAVVDPKDSNVVWLGTGENASQRSAHFGDGVYKTTDAGKTWKRMGLATSEHIGKIIVDPRNSNVVWVASQGPLFSAGGERSLYKTTDGGQTWKASLTISEDTGISDVVFDPKNPDILYASSYQRRRSVGQMIGGGPEGGIFKTANGGNTWTKLARGLPEGDVGRIALAVDPRKPTTVFALIHAKAAESGFYRSDDNGASWTKVNNYVGGGAVYYTELFVDPWRADTIWSVNTPLDWSRDGGIVRMDRRTGASKSIRPRLAGPAQMSDENAAGAQGAQGRSGAGGQGGADQQAGARGAGGGGGRGGSAARTGMRLTLSVHTRQSGCTGEATSCTAATIAAIIGSGSAPI